MKVTYADSKKLISILITVEVSLTTNKLHVTVSYFFTMEDIKPKHLWIIPVGFINIRFRINLSWRSVERWKMNYPQGEIKASRLIWRKRIQIWKEAT